MVQHNNIVQLYNIVYSIISGPNGLKLLFFVSLNMICISLDEILMQKQAPSFENRTNDKQTLWMSHKLDKCCCNCPLNSSIEGHYVLLIRFVWSTYITYILFENGWNMLVVALKSTTWRANSEFRYEIVRTQTLFETMWSYPLFAYVTHAT